MDVTNIKPVLDNRPSPNLANTAEVKSNPDANPAAGVKAEQAVETHLSQVSRHKLGITVLHQSLARNMDLFQTDKPLEEPKQKEIPDNKSLFDFEEVAKNVLNFVTGVISAAYDSGADQDELNDLLGQARKGVSDGVKSAFDSLGLSEDSDDELAKGINKAHDKINFGLDELGKQINADNFGSEQAVFGSLVTENSISNSQSGEIAITTKDGDKVSISFSAIQAYMERLEQTQLAAEKTTPQGNQYFLSSEEKLTTANLRSAELALAVEGELDEAELVAIGDLMLQISDVADEFFNGDVQAAYEQALKIGFDETEIGNFALELNQRSEVVSKTTSQVAAYRSENTAEKELPKSVANPIQEYVKKLLDMTKQGEQVADKEELESVVNQVLGNQYQLTGNELISAMNRFNHFNGQVLNNLNS
ncbi:DUF5610 domain-containing protein [Catenovulum maritimum]|uniref:DUF5610 domain-containing protein n=1 Tax=Catenovulum maritimum TaxID=1513271 RepID=UPI00066094AC|nr:DUF5610 domain-containing protein [Catenovulum maritimum]